MSLLFNTEEDCITANDLIFQNLVQYWVSLGYTYEDGVVGKVSGVDQINYVKILRWDIPRQDVNGKWYIANPIEVYPKAIYSMDGVNGYIVGEAVPPPDPEE